MMIARLGFTVIALSVVLIPIQAQAPQSHSKRTLDGIFSQCEDLLRRGEYRKAAHIANRALDDGSDPYLYELLGFALASQEDHKGARDAFTEAINHGARNSVVYLNRAQAACCEKDWPSALDDYKKVIARDPNNAMAYACRARAYLAQHDLRHAREDLRSARRLAPRDAEIQTRVGYHYQSIGARDAAIECYSAALAKSRIWKTALIDPQRWEIGSQRNTPVEFKQSGPSKTSTHLAFLYASRGILHRELEQWSLAIDDFTERIRIDSTDPEGYYHRGITYHSMKRFREAQQDLEAACDLGGGALPEFALAKLLATSADAAVRDGKRAIVYAKKALAQSSEDRAYLDVLATAYAEAGQFDEAVRCEEKAIANEVGPEAGLYQLRLEFFRSREPFHQVEPDSITGRLPSTSFEAARAAIAKQAAGDREGALASWRQATTLTPRLRSADYMLGDALARANDFAGAISEFNGCLRDNPEHVQALYGRSEVHLLLGKYSEARADVDQVLVLQPKHSAGRSLRLRTLCYLGEEKTAQEEIQTLLGKYPDDIHLHLAQAHCDVLARRYQAALDDLTELIRQHPKLVSAYAERALVCTALGKTDDADRDLAQCRQLAPQLHKAIEGHIKAMKAKPAIP